MDYENWKPADKRILDTQWEEQSNLFRHWARKLALKLKEVDDQKTNMERIGYEMDRVFRAKRAGEKFTEAVIKADVSLNSKYMQEQNTLSELQGELGMLKAEIESLHQRKSALENLVKLHGQEYFSVPFVSEPERERHNTKKTKEIIRRKINKEV